MPLMLNDLSAWITVDDDEEEELENHDIQVVDSGKTVTCWIASQAGKRFKVWFKDKLYSRPEFISGLVSLDGVEAGAKFIGPFAEDRKAFKDGHITSLNTKRPFTFSRIQLTDNETELEEPISTDLGEIALHIWRAQIVGIQEPSRANEARLGNLKVDERAKNGVTHKAHIGVEEKTNPIPFWQAKYLGKEPIASFIFKYRSIDVLRANGTVPRRTGEKRRATAEPEERTTKKEREMKTTQKDTESDDAEIKALEEELQELERIRTLKDRLKKLKERRPSSSNEPGSSRAKGVEIIDLT